MKPRDGGTRRRFFTLRTAPLVLLICSLALVFSSIALTLQESETKLHFTVPRANPSDTSLYAVQNRIELPEEQERNGPIASGSLPCRECRWDWQGQVLVLTVYAQSTTRLAGLALVRSCVEVDRLEWNASVAKVKVMVDGKDVAQEFGGTGRGDNGRFRVIREHEGYGCVEMSGKRKDEDEGTGLPFCGKYVQVVRFELENDALERCVGKRVQVAVDIPGIGPLHKTDAEVLTKCSNVRHAEWGPSRNEGRNGGLNGPVVLFDAVFPKYLGGFIQPFGARICTRVTGKINHHELSVWLRYYIEVHKVDSIVIYDVREPASSSLELEVDGLVNDKIKFVGNPSAAKPQSMSFGSSDLQIVDVRPLRTALRLVLKRGLQTPLMDDCLMSANGTYRWVGFIDIDEFIEIEPDQFAEANLRLPGSASPSKRKDQTHGRQKAGIIEGRRSIIPRPTLHEYLEGFKHKRHCEAISFGPVHFALEICANKLTLEHTYAELFAAATYHLDEDREAVKAFAKAFPNRFLRRALGWEEGVEGRRKLFVNPQKAWMAKSVHQISPFGKRGTERSHKRCTSSMNRARILHFRGYGNLLGLRNRCSRMPGTNSGNLSTSELFGCQPLASNGETHHFCDSYLRRPYMKLSSNRDYRLHD